MRPSSSRSPRSTTADLDYTPVTNQTRNFPAGETIQTFTVTPTPDYNVEANETLTFSQSGLVNGGRSVTTGTNGTGTINNADLAYTASGSTVLTVTVLAFATLYPWE